MMIYLFVWRSEVQRAVTDSQGSTEELLACVQGQQMMETGEEGHMWEQVSWCYKQYTNIECT